MVNRFIVIGLPLALILSGCNDTGSFLNVGESSDTNLVSGLLAEAPATATIDDSTSPAIGQDETETSGMLNQPVVLTPPPQTDSQTFDNIQATASAPEPTNTSSGNTAGGYGFKSVNYLDNLDLSPKVYYVDGGSAGRDSNPGTANAPFKTIQYAINQLRQNPDHDLIVRDGVYKETVLIDGLRGKDNDPIVIRAESKWGVKFNAIELTRDLSSVIEVANSEHLKIAGFFVNGSRGFGISIKDSSHVLLKENKTYNTGHSGIKGVNSDYIDYFWNDISRHVQVWGQEGLSIEKHNHFRIIGNKVHDRPNKGQAYSLQSDYLLTYPLALTKDHYTKCFSQDPYDFEGTGLIRMDGCAVQGGEAIDVKVGCKHGEVAYNIVDGVENKFGIYLDAWGIDDKDGSELIQEDIDVHHNIVTNSGTGFAFSTENGSSEKGVLRNIRVHDNISFANDGAGIGIGDFGGDNVSFRIDKVRRVENISIRNNMILGNIKHGLWLGNPNTKNIKFKDNVIVKNAGKQVFFEDKVNQSSTESIKYTLTDNIIDTTSRDYSWLHNDSGNLIQDLPDAAASNGYLTNLPIVSNNNKGIADDIDSLIKTLRALNNG